MFLRLIVLIACTLMSILGLTPDLVNGRSESRNVKPTTPFCVNTDFFQNLQISFIYSKLRLNTISSGTRLYLKLCYIKSTIVKSLNIIHIFYLIFENLGSLLRIIQFQYIFTLPN